jgi:hypothetical protein
MGNQEEKKITVDYETNGLKWIEGNDNANSINELVNKILPSTKGYTINQISEALAKVKQTLEIAYIIK